MEKKLLWLKKIAITCGGLIFNQLQSKFIHWILFPAVCMKWGLWVGCPCLIIATAVMGYLQLKGYDKAQKVLHSVDTIHQIENGEVKTLFQLALWILLKFNRWFVLLVLATQFDPFIATAYLRDTRRFVWKQTTIFVVSITIGTLYTIVLAPLIVPPIFRFFTSFF